MVSITKHFLPILSVLRFVLPALVLIVPIVLVFFFRRSSLRAPDRSRVWFAYRQNTRLLFLTTVVGWWALWDWNRPLLFSPRYLLVWPALSNPTIQQLIFWILPIGSLAIAQTMSYSTDKLIAQLHWSRMALLRQGFWSVVRFGIPLFIDFIFRIAAASFGLSARVRRLGDFRALLGFLFLLAAFCVPGGSRISSCMQCRN